MLASTEILRILHFHLMQQAQMTTFQEKCGLDWFFFLRQASVCSDCRSAASSFASIGSLCLQKKLIPTYCLWQTLCIFQPVLAFVKSEKRGRPHVCVCGGAKLMASTLELYCSLTVNNPTQKSKIVKLCVKLQSDIHEAIFICWVQPCNAYH